MKEHIHKELPSSKQSKEILIFLCSFAQSLANLEFAHTSENIKGESTSLISCGGVFSPQEYWLHVRGGWQKDPYNQSSMLPSQDNSHNLACSPSDICVWMISILIADLVKVWKTHQQTDCEFLLFWWCLISPCTDTNLHSTVHSGSRPSNI